MSALLRILAWALALALVALPVVAVVNGWIGADRWPLRTLRLQGDLQRVDAGRVRATVAPFAQRGFFAVRLDDARRALEQLPWVERADVRRHWPDVLEVRVVEHRPFARWGDAAVLSEHGRRFALPRGADAEIAALPRLHGPDAQVHAVIALFNQSRELFQPQGLDVRELAVDARGSWSLRLADGTELVVGREDPLPRLRRFARMLPQLLPPRGRRLARADLRYTNGFALLWRAAGDAVSAAPPIPAGGTPA